MLLITTEFVFMINMYVHVYDNDILIKHVINLVINMYCDMINMIENMYINVFISGNNEKKCQQEISV